MTPPFIIGIAGGSGSGKTTVTRKLVETIGSDKAAVIVQDNYYRDQAALTLEQRRLTNYDHPHAFDWPLLMQHIDDLKNGVPVDMPVYDFANDTRSERTITLVPSPVILIEGFYSLYDAAIRDAMSLKIFVDTDADVRFIRRLQRDIAQRGRSMQSVIDQYMATVRPMHNQFIEPTKRFADVILPHGCNDPAVDMITARIESLII
ncbi:uridine kinase [Paludibacterium yongneupense]|uniref:uridine kinase n=1 Tax=Paludibacterium yongneupense TaxID=400061 RepID=UPI00040E60AD|nr:uridine kinase [Paludibacterium yongneupense]